MPNLHRWKVASSARTKKPMVIHCRRQETSITRGDNPGSVEAKLDLMLKRCLTSIHAGDTEEIVYESRHDWIDRANTSLSYYTFRVVS